MNETDLLHWLLSALVVVWMWDHRQKQKRVKALEGELHAVYQTLNERLVHLRDTQLKTIEATTTQVSQIYDLMGSLNRQQMLLEEAIRKRTGPQDTGCGTAPRDGTADTSSGLKGEQTPRSPSSAAPGPVAGNQSS